jgi:3-hydroxyacyl-CoA dehydrogenase
VVYAKDTPNFIGNRIGVFSILATIHHTAAFKLGFDEVDAHRPAGRAAQVGHLPHLGRGRPGHHGPRHQDHGRHPARRSVAPVFQSPAWLQALIGKGALGQKTGAGIFRKAGKDIVVLDLEKQDYRPADRAAAPEVVEILKTRNPAEKFARSCARASIRRRSSCGRLFRDLFHYSAYHLADIAEPRATSTWRSAGATAGRWARSRPGRPPAGSRSRWIADDIVAGKAMSSAPLPDWVFDGREGVHAAEGSFSPAKNAKLPRSTLPGLQAPALPRSAAGRGVRTRRDGVENDGVRLWTDGDDIAWLSFKTKMHTVSTTPCWTACRRPSASPSARSRAW